MRAGISPSTIVCKELITIIRVIVCVEGARAAFKVKEPVDSSKSGFATFLDVIRDNSTRKSSRTPMIALCGKMEHT